MYGPQIWSNNLKTRAEEGLGLGFTVRLKRVFFWFFLNAKHFAARQAMVS
jgi:hypothetical protein